MTWKTSLQKSLVNVQYGYGFGASNLAVCIEFIKNTGKHIK